MRRSQWGAMPIRQNGLHTHATCRIYELDSCTPVSRPTMNYSVMNLPKAQALCTPHHENCGTSQAFCTPRMNLPTASGSDSEHFLRIPFTKIVGRLRLLSTPMMKLPTVSGSEHLLHSIHKSWGTSQALCTPMVKIADSLRLWAPPFTKFVVRLRLLAPP